jgi:hypothetical protein
MIWIAPALTSAALVTQVVGRLPRTSLMLWSAGLVAMLVVGAWPVNIAICGMVTGISAYRVRWDA